MALTKHNFKKSRNRLEGQWETAERPVRQAPQQMCTRCPSCRQLLFNAETEKAHGVCTECGYHFRLSAHQRAALVCDEGSFEGWDEEISSQDPLAFPGYDAKLQKSLLGQNATEAVLCGRAKIGGFACAFFAMEPGFMMGSMGSVVGERITRCFERAARERLPVVGFTVSGGARMQEGILSLMQMAKTSGAVKLHGDAGLLYIAVLTDPTTGGVTASFAMEGDILIAEPGALIAFAGPRVIEQTLRQTLPKNFQRAEYLLEHGFLDAVIPRQKLKGTLTYLLRLHAPNTALE